MLAIVGYSFRWLFVISMAILYNYFIIIVRETFDQLNDNVLPLWILLDYIADIIYIIDMFVQLFTSETLDVVMLVLLPNQCSVILI